MTEEKVYFTEQPDDIGGTEVKVRKEVDGEEVTYSLPERQDIRNHSPDGFSWGYGGSGPAQLALAILADYRDDEFAVRHYQDFKKSVISNISPDDPLRITSSQIDSWINEE